MRKGALEKEIKQDLIDIRSGALITPVLQKILKLITCNLCFGKGYSTIMIGELSGYTDFGPLEKVIVAGPHRDIAFCVCDRGKQLKKLWPKK